MGHGCVNATFPIKSNITCGERMGTTAWLRENRSSANDVRPTSSKGQVHGPSYDLYGKIKSLAEKEGLRTQAQPFVNVCKPVKPCQKYYSLLLNSSPPDSDFPYHHADISLTATTNNISFTIIITTSGSQVTLRDLDLDYAQAFSEDRVSQSN
jgi:hypothetical protein